MAAEVEVQSAEVGRSGGRLHLNPLTDSNNKNLLEISPLNQSRLISPELSKPAPGPKPRLTPKPFTVDRNPTIKPILAPKPQPKPRLEPTRPGGYRPELPVTPKPQTPPLSIKPRPGTTGSTRLASASFRTTKLNVGQTTKPVAQPFKPAPPLAGDPSKPISPVPKPSNLTYSRSLKRPPSAEWFGSTKKEERDLESPTKVGTPITRAKSMGYLLQIGQEEEEKTKLEAAVPLRAQPRGIRPRPVSAIYPTTPTKTESPNPPFPRTERRPLSADLTSKFESGGLSLHRKTPTATENSPENSLQKKEQVKSASPQISNAVTNKPIVSDQSKDNVSAKDNEDMRGASIKSRISLLLDSSASPATPAPGQAPDNTPTQTAPEAEPAVGVRQLIKQLTVDQTTPNQSPVLKPALKPRPLPLDLTKRFSPDPTVSPGDASDRHDAGKAPEKRGEDSIRTPNDEKTFVDLKDSLHQTKTPVSEAPDLLLPPKESEAHTVRASVFENVVEKHSILMVDENKSDKPILDEPDEEGKLVTATYKEPVSPSGPVRVVHAFDTVPATEGSTAVSESVPSAQWEDKAMTLRTRRSEGTKTAAEKTSPEQISNSPRYLRVGALPKWTVDDNIELETGMPKDKPRDFEVEDVSAAAKRLKTQQIEEQAKPKATYFALTGQMQETVAVTSDTGDSMTLSDPNAQWSSQGKVLSFRRNPSLDEAFAKAPENNAHAEAQREKQKQLELERQAELEYARFKEREMQREFERQRQRAFEKEKQEFDERQRALEINKQIELERLKHLEFERQRQVELKRQRQMEKERQKQPEIDRQRQIELERQKLVEAERLRQSELEKQRQLELENQRQIELKKQNQELERQKQLEMERQKQVEMERQKQLEIERQKQLEMERQKQLEIDRQRQIELERQKQAEAERLRQIELEKQRQIELENQRQIELKKQKQELERQKQLEIERQKRLEAEKLRQIEIQRQKHLEAEKQRHIELERQTQQELERQRQMELDRQRQAEIERQKQIKLEKQKQMEAEKLKQKEIERQKQIELEKQRQIELERQKLQEIERAKQLELEKERQRQLERERREMERQRQREEERRQKELDKEQKLMEKQKERQRMQAEAEEQERRQQAELQKQRDRQRVLEMEKQRLREKMEKEQAEKLRQMALEQEMLRIRELDKEKERQKEMEREKQRELELHRQRELEKQRQKQLDLERQELEKQRQRQQEQEKERQRKEELERMKELERRQLLEFEKHKQAARQQILEQEKSQLREKMEREEAERMRQVAKQQEAERQRLKDKQKKEEQERIRLESAALRPKVVDLDSVMRLDQSKGSSRDDPSTRWKEPSPKSEQSLRPGILDIDSFASHNQPSPTRDLFPVVGIQEVNPRVPMSPQNSGGLQTPVWTTSPQESWELHSVEMSVDKPEQPRKPLNKTSPEQLLLRQEERRQVPQRRWSGRVLDDPFHMGPFSGPETKPAPSAPVDYSSSTTEQVWLPREPPQGQSRSDGPSQRRTQGSQELNRIRSRSMSRRSAPSSSAVESSLSRMRSRSAHRDLDRDSWVQQKHSVSTEDESKDSETPVHETDSQYGTWETGLRSEESLTPATPSSDGNLSPSPKKPASPQTPVDNTAHLTPDATDDAPPPAPSSEPLPFPDAPVTLLDNSALRSRAQLGKKRAPRTRPSRAIKKTQAEGGASDDWIYKDSTEEKVENKKEDSDSEEQPKVSEAGPTAASSQPQRVALFPGMDPSALMAQLKKRGDSDNQTDGPTPAPSQLTRSPKSPFLPRATRVLRPPGGKENGEEDSPQWLKELKSKKRLSQYESES